MLRVDVKRRRGSFFLDARLDAPTPGVVALFGRSGCGKSTLINVIAGLLAADSGRIQLDEAVLLDDERKLTVAAEHRRMGYVFQDARLFPHLNVAANLRYAMRRARRTPYIALDSVVQLLGLDSLMQRRTYELSGGERQRVAIARALLSQPRLLLLDEPLASLDRSRREEVLPYLVTLRDQLAIPMVYVSHQFDEVLRLATYLVVMDGGRTVAQGEIGAMSLDPVLRTIIGADEVGAIIDGVVIGIDGRSGLCRVRVGDGELRMQPSAAMSGSVLRVQLLARDVIIATQPPQNLSVRNVLRGSIVSIADDGADSDLVTIDIGAALVLARITKSATRELSLRVGMNVWALVKTVSLRGRTIPEPALLHARS